ncbi:MAG TPA: Hpt domain-containing protein, partial [Chroococcales cyanobacterium]
MYEELIPIFFEESTEHLAEIESDLLALESIVSMLDTELINRIFRAAHSIKGAACCLEFERICRLAHHLECLLTEIRDKGLTPSHDLITVLLSGFDFLGGMIAKGAASNAIDISEQVERLRVALGWTEGSLAGIEADRFLERAFPASPGIISELPLVSHTTIRVEIRKLDRLLELVGEVLILEGQVHQVGHQLQGVRANEFQGLLAHLDSSIHLLQDLLRDARLVSIGPTFRHYQRILRDLSLSLGKKINLIVEGENTTIDRNLAERLADPLRHLVRNAADHGIE